MTTETPEATPKMRYIFIAISQDRDRGTYHVQLRPEPAAMPVMQSRKVRTPSEARREARRLFGELEWKPPVEFGLTNQPFVVEMAQFDWEE